MSEVPLYLHNARHACSRVAIGVELGHDTERVGQRDNQTQPSIDITSLRNSRLSTRKSLLSMSCPHE